VVLGVGLGWTGLAEINRFDIIINFS